MPGRANRLAARAGAKPSSCSSSRREPARARRRRRACDATGIPAARRAGARLSRRAAAARAPQPRCALLVFGGSQGARQINEAMIEAAPSSTRRALRIVHQTGEADRERVAAAYAPPGIPAEVIAFEPRHAAPLSLRRTSPCAARAR